MSRLGVLICEPNASSDDNLRQFLDFKNAFADRYDHFVVGHGKLDDENSAFYEGLDELYDNEVNHIIVILGVLCIAAHSTKKLEKQIKNYKKEKNNLNLKIDMIAGLDINSEILYAAKTQLEKAENKSKNICERDNSLLLVVGEDGFDEFANSKIDKVARMLWEGMGYGWAQVCLMGGEQSSIVKSLDYAIKLNFNRIIILPYFLFIGNQSKTIFSSTNSISQHHPEIEFITASHINHENSLLTVYGNSLKAFLRKNKNMNCMNCSYREQIIR